MTRSKPISMKKLYQWAGMFLMMRYGEEVTEENFSKIDAKAKKELAYLNEYIKYVWEHRND